MTKSLLEVSYICDGNPVCSDPRKANYFFMVCLGTRGVLPTNLNNMTSLPLLLNDKVTGDNFLSPSKYIEALTLLHCWIFTRSYTFFFIFFLQSKQGICMLLSTFPVEQTDVRQHRWEWSFTVQQDLWKNRNHHWEHMPSSRETELMKTGGLLWPLLGGESKARRTLDRPSGQRLRADYQVNAPVAAFSSIRR